MLIAIGVRCVIAAGWAVDDAACRHLREHLYRSPLRGNRFINAVGGGAGGVLRHRDNNTWAAYQCYGDPDWVFRRDGPDANVADRRVRGRVCRRGVGGGTGSLALETIVVQTKFQGYAPAAQLERVRQLEKRFTTRWGRNGAVAELFERHSTTRDVASAIRWHERAVAADDGAAPIKARRNSWRTPGCVSPGRRSRRRSICARAAPRS